MIIVGSAYGLPLSTTHCMVGAVTGEVVRAVCLPTFCCPACIACSVYSCRSTALCGRRCRPHLPACLPAQPAGIGVVEAVSGRRPEGSTGGKAFNWLLLIKFFCGWVATLVIAALTAAAFTAQGV